jgi:hypothetical protein
METAESRDPEENKIPLYVNYILVMQSKFNPIFVLLFVKHPGKENTGRSMMFSVITNIFNKKPKNLP